MKRAILTLVFVLPLMAQGIVQAQSEQLKTVVGLRNFLWVNTEVCTAGQPTAKHLKELKAQGVRAVFNIRRPSEHDATSEAALVQKLGMKYFNIPIDSSDIRDADVEGFLRIVADPANRPIFVHCGSANRVGAFWMIKRATVDGWNVGC
jgi:uncharacterized protein (TIGR01244 family)